MSLLRAASVGLETHPVVPSHPDHPELLLLNRDTKHSYENTWHCDATWRAKPPFGSVLRCVVCPEVGGDTMWANMALAYERLPRHIKQRIANLRAKHSIEHSFGGSMSAEDRAKLSAANPMVEHPVVRTHPETNEKVLFVNQGFTTHFVNFHNNEDVRYGQDFTIEANNLLNYLVRQAEIPEYQVRLRWKPNTIAIWDNRATQHYAIHDFYPAVRKMMRATIVGDTTILIVDYRTGSGSHRIEGQCRKNALGGACGRASAPGSRFRISTRKLLFDLTFDSVASRYRSTVLKSIKPQHRTRALEAFARARQQCADDGVFQVRRLSGR